MAMAAAANNEVKKAKALANQQAAQEQKMQQQVQKAQAEQEQKEQIMEQRRVMLKAILSPEAAARSMRVIPFLQILHGQSCAYSLCLHQYLIFEWQKKRELLS